MPASVDLYYTIAESVISLVRDWRRGLVWCPGYLVLARDAWIKQDSIVVAVRPSASAQALTDVRISEDFAEVLPQESSARRFSYSLLKLSEVQRKSGVYFEVILEHGSSEKSVMILLANLSLTEVMAQMAGTSASPDSFGLTSLRAPPPKQTAVPVDSTRTPGSITIPRDPREPGRGGRGTIRGLTDTGRVPALDRSPVALPK